VVIFLIAAFVATIGIMIYSGIQNEMNTIPAGTIVDKQYEPERIDTTTGKNGYTSTWYRRAIYRFKLRGEKDEVMVDYWTEVSAEDYFNYKIGDWYVR
jgi:uncharacterized protein YxeA